jgi:signal transduction histidine kinase/DNA-binding response OmpR family regulator
MKILYVEDNPLDIELTSRELSRGIPTLKLAVRTTVAAGAAVLEEQGDYDVVLTDLRLPDGSGLDIVNLVRARNLASAVVVLTGQGDEEIAVAAIKAGADDYVAKREGYSRRLPQLVLAAVDRFRVETTRKAGMLRVLYAEHNQADIELTRRHLAQRAPHIQVDTVYSAAEVLAQLPAAAGSESAYDVLLLDFGLPDGDAIELLKVLRNERRLDIPVVLVTGQGDEEIAAQVLRLGASDYIVKHGGYLFEVPVALENAHARAGLARERAALERRLAEMDAVYHVAHALLTAQTQEEAVGILLHQAMAALQTPAAAVWLLDSAQEALRTAATSGWCECFGSAQLARDASIAGSVLGSRLGSPAPRVERDIRAIPNLPELLASCAPTGWGGCWVPIRTPRALVGVLFLSVALPRTIDGEQARLLLSLAEMAGSMIERLRLLDEAHVQAALTQQIVDTVPEGLALVDSSGQILLANPAAEQLLTRLGQTAVGTPPGAIARLGPWPLSEILARGKRWQEFEHQGRTYTVSCRQVVPADPHSAWVLVLADLTNQRVQQRYQEVQERLATVGQLAAGIAHDFNNVLGVITVYADILLAAPNLEMKQQSQLATIFDQAHHAANLVRQILDFSRRAVMERSRIDLFPLLNEQVELLRRMLPENIDLQLQVDQMQLEVDADPTRLRQVLMNLAINARDAMPEGGRLSFYAATIDVGPGHSPMPLPDMAPGAWLYLAVEDTGTGIATEHLPHIFEPFFTTKAPGAGTGLGLAQVYGIVKQHGGALDVTSTLGKGTCFRLFLPLAAAAGEPPCPPAAAPPAGRGEWILLVEDNAELRTAVAISLESQGYRVVAEPHAEAALAAARAAGHPIDLVLTDLVMPGMSGIEMFAALRPTQPYAKLIVMTGHPLTEARMAILENIGSWIQKPFALNSLLRKVRLQLDAPRLAAYG